VRLRLACATLIAALAVALLAVPVAGPAAAAPTWKEVPIQANPGGYEMVVYVGVAAPVRRPAPVARPDRPAPALHRLSSRPA